jgi:H+/Cl- antiporter ClcA
MDEVEKINAIQDPKYFNSLWRYLIGVIFAFLGFFIFQWIVTDPYFKGYEVPVSLIGCYMIAKIVIIIWRNLLLKNDSKKA